jgi:hypothetical protein
MGATFGVVSGGGAGPQPATTVVGPDAYGTPASVGTSTQYARADHDHGLPAAPSATITQQSSFIAADQTISVADTFQHVTSLSLGAGTWLLIGQAQWYNNGTGTFHVSIHLTDGTTVYASAEQQLYTGVAPWVTSLSVHAVITIAATKTIYLDGAASVTTMVIKASGAIFANSNGETGLIALKLA